MISKHLFKTALIFAGMGLALPASAHTLSNKTLRIGFGAQATDVWQVTCSADAVLGNSSRLVAQVLDKSPGTNLLGLIIVKGNAAVTTIDSKGGDTIPSPWVQVNGGNGVYTMLVNHTQAGNKVYNIEFHCESANGSHTPTTTPTVPVQDN